jgi:hypothetical protein
VANVTVLGLADGVQNGAVTLDGLDRSCVVSLAEDEHPFQTETFGLSKHVAQCPDGHPTTACRRSDAVADVAIPPSDIVRAVPQRDTAEHSITLHDPAAGAAAVLRRIGLLLQQLHPCGEPARRFHVVRRVEPEAVLMGARASLVVCLEPLLMQIDRGRDQCEHVVILFLDRCSCRQSGAG